MKIGINASFLRKQNTGIGQVTANFLKKIAEVRGVKSAIGNDQPEFVLYLEEDIDLELPRNFRKEIFLPPYKRDDLIRKIWWEKYLLPKMISKDGCDVFLSLYQCPTILHGEIRHLMVVHDIIPKLFPEYLNNARKRLYWGLCEKGIGAADRIIAVSKRTEKDMIRHLAVDAAKITVSYVAADELYEEEVDKEKSRKTLEHYALEEGYIYHGGGLESRKNTESVLIAYKTLLERNKQLHFIDKVPELVISGKMNPGLAPLLTDVERLVKDMDLFENVRLLGFVPQADLPTIYSGASLFVYPSRYEGFGLPVLEAMSQGVPVIASKKSSLPEVGGDAVLYCDPDDTDDLAMVMRNVLTNKAVAETLAERGKKRSRNFTWDKFATKVMNIIISRTN